MADPVWVKLFGEPVLCFYATSSALAYIGDYLAYPYLDEGNLGTLYSEIEVDGESQENANQTVKLRNEDYELTDLFSIPPLQAEVWVCQGATRIFRGILKTVSLTDTDCSLSIEA